MNEKDSIAQCDICLLGVYMNCNKINLTDYKYLQSSNDPWYCFSCCSEIFPFGTLSYKDFLSYSNFLSRYQQ